MQVGSKWNKIPNKRLPGYLGETLAYSSDSHIYAMLRDGLKYKINYIKTNAWLMLLFFDNLL